MKNIQSKKSFSSILCSEWFIVSVSILVLLVLGIFLHDDFGLQWDSQSNHSIGQANTSYILDRDESFYSFNERYYGPLFEILLFNITKNLPERATYFMRHLATYLFFLLGIVAFYFLNKRIIKQWPIALLGCAMLVISPRIFGDAFYNSKDISFLVVFIFCILTLHLYLEKSSVLHIIFHSLSSAILISLRIPGIVMVAITLGFLILSIFFQQNQKWQRVFLHSVIYLILTCLLTYAFWPILWHDPIHEIQNAFQLMSHYPWRGGVVLYRGSFVNAANLPWHYIPVWMMVTIPLGYIMLAVIGFFDHLLSLIKSQWKSIFINYQDFLLITVWLFVPIAAVIMLNSVLYDGWRQMFFVYPAVIIFSGMGVKTLLTRQLKKIPLKINRIIAGVLVAIAITEPLCFMVRTHPLEMVYFNQLVTMRDLEIRHYFEMEYWGLSYRQGLEYVLAANSGQRVRIAIANSPGRLNALLLPQPDRERLVYVSTPEKADYFLTNYRFHPEDYEYPNEVFNIMIGDEKVFSVFKMQPSQ